MLMFTEQLYHFHDKLLLLIHCVAKHCNIRTNV